MVWASRNSIDKSLDEQFNMMKKEVSNLISNIGEKLISESRSHFLLIWNQLGDLRKYVECLNAIVDLIITKMEKLEYNVQNFEAKVKTTTVKVLKDFFGLKKQQNVSNKEHHLELNGGDLENPQFHA